MAGGNDLRAIGRRHLGDEVVDITLAQDFQVRVGLVKQQHRAQSTEIKPQVLYEQEG